MNNESQNYPSKEDLKLHATSTHATSTYDTGTHGTGAFGAGTHHTDTNPSSTRATNYLTAFASTQLAQWEEQQLLRTPATFHGPQTPVTRINGRDYLLFSSSNYLNFAEHPALKAAASEATEKWGTGSGGSRLTTGTTSLHRELEAALAETFGAEDAVFFGSGYEANLSALQTLVHPNLEVFSDQLNHASLIDGLRIARAHPTIYPHATLPTLPDGPALVVSDGVFSMDGDVVDLPSLGSALGPNHALFLDDAHSIGVLGPRGLGTHDHYQCEPPLIRLGTASKALGTQGGFILAPQEICELLRQKARSFVYSTSPTPATCASVLAAVHLLREDPSHTQRLQQNIAYLGERLAGLLPNEPVTPIIPIPVGCESAALATSRQFAAEGIFAPAIRYPTVSKGQAIIRITLMANHSKEQIDTLVAALDRALE